MKSWTTGTRRIRGTGPAPDEVVDRLLARVGELVETEGSPDAGGARALDLTGERGPVGHSRARRRWPSSFAASSTSASRSVRSIHSAEFEEYGKPHPGVFLSAAASLAVAPPTCLVLEDSAAGVSPRRRHDDRHRGADVVTIVARAEFLLADLVLDSLEESRPAWLDERFA